MELLIASDKNQDGCVYCHRILSLCVAIVNIFFKYQHTYMCMLIIIRMIYILQKNDIDCTAN